MSAPSLLRALTPLAWLAAGVVALVCLVVLLGGLGFRWDPLNLQQKRLAAALDRARTASAEAAAQDRARRLEAQGAADQALRVDHHQQKTTKAERATAAVLVQARSADDADQPLDPRRADRLRDHDGQLCRIAPGLDGCAARGWPCRPQRQRPCALAVLPAEPTTGDLEAAYVLRGAQIVACDGARRLAVETLLAERAMQSAHRTGQGAGR